MPALDTAGSDAQLRDRLAFILLALRQVQASIEPTAEAWERRAYWVKADQFRRSWAWAGTSGDAILKAVEAGDLGAACRHALSIQPHLPLSRTAKARDLSSVWAGCYQRLKGA